MMTKVNDYSRKLTELDARAAIQSSLGSGGNLIK
jgi:hypothetical protein